MTALSLVNASKWYGPTRALSSMFVTFDRGQIVGIVGSNGAGKTTLLRVCAGLTRPTRGVVDQKVPRSAIRYFGGERTLPPAISARTWCRRLGGRDASSVTRSRFGVLSRGTRQRIGLVATLSGTDISLILLDEPWEGLDPDASRWLSAELLRRRQDGASVVVSSHRIHDLAAVCDRSVFIACGRIVEDERLGETLCYEQRVAALFSAFDRTREAS